MHVIQLEERMAELIRDEVRNLEEWGTSLRSIPTQG